jgi:hypothetical protein
VRREPTSDRQRDPPSTHLGSICTVTRAAFTASASHALHLSQSLFPLLSAYLYYLPHLSGQGAQTGGGYAKKGCASLPSLPRHTPRLFTTVARCHLPLHRVALPAPRPRFMHRSQHDCSATQRTIRVSTTDVSSLLTLNPGTDCSARAQQSQLRPATLDFG